MLFPKENVVVFLVSPLEIRQTDFYKYWGGMGGILESLCPSVVLSLCQIVSAQYLLNCSTFLKKSL